MSDYWEFYPCTMGDDAASIFADMGVKDKLQSAPENIVRVTLTYKAPREDGLPTREEFDQVNIIEDDISKFAEEASDWYVGRITVAGCRYFYI